MKLGTHPILHAAIVATLLSGPAYAATVVDWTLPTAANVIQAQPSNLAVQANNPPGFSWPMYQFKPAVYDFELTGPGSAAPVVTSGITRNWYLPTTPLAAGTYSWRVRASAPLSAWSSPRTFVIDAALSKTFIIPDSATIKAHVASLKHPVSLPASVLPISAWSADRKAALTALQAQVLRCVTSIPAYADSMWVVQGGPVTALAASQLATVRWAMIDLVHQSEASALVWYLTRDPQYLKEAILRGNQLAAFSPTGPTSYASDDDTDRSIALALAKSLDFLDAGLDAATKKAWQTALAARMVDIYNAQNAANGGLDEYPLDSHGVVAEGYVALIAALTLNDIPAASNWFDLTVRDYMNMVFPWSLPSSDGAPNSVPGGYIGGTSYAEDMAVVALNVWQGLANATGVNLFEKPSSYGFMQELMYFLPPGSPNNVFGDGHELAPNITELKGFSSRFATPQAAWYANNLVGSEDNLTLLEAQSPLPINTVTPAPPVSNAVIFKSIGWAAMHSDISDRSRTSVYFKSSPFGSYNHAHADQNALVLFSGGRPLLIEAGNYDYYGSPLWFGWYRQSRGHNAVTFVPAAPGNVSAVANVVVNNESVDTNGKSTPATGQFGAAMVKYDAMSVPLPAAYTPSSYNANWTNRGQITSFSSAVFKDASGKPSTSFDYVSGDATDAYNPIDPNNPVSSPPKTVISQARRQIWYVRTINGALADNVIVLDSLTSVKPGTFEWNLHSAVPMVLSADGKQVVTIKNVDRSVCVRPVSTGLTFAKRLSPIVNDAQSHGAYVSPSGTSAEFLMVLDVGCKNPLITLTPTSSGRTLNVGGMSIALPK